MRRAVELLVQTLDRVDQDLGRKLLSGWTEAQVYEVACTVMMRLVFLLAAEERGLLLKGERFFDEHYAVSTLRATLREAADRQGEEVLERRHDAWSRLLATFRAVHGGVWHETMRLPAYGGSLFDPDRFPFLEGRAAGTCWRAMSPPPFSRRQNRRERRAGKEGVATNRSLLLANEDSATGPLTPHPRRGTGSVACCFHGG